MRRGFKTLIFGLSIIAVVFSFGSIFAQETFPFTGEVTSDRINIRCDSTVSSEAICTVNKGSYVEVVLELYDWYKIRLPKSAPSFIKKVLVTLAQDLPAEPLSGNPVDINTEKAKSARVCAERVNIRLFPNESSPILGKAGRDEIITVLQDKGDWYKIEPVNSSFGWINKRFVRKAPVTKKPAQELIEPPQKAPVDNSITVEGTLKPFGVIFKRPATHKLVTADSSIFLLKGDKKILDGLNNHKVKVKGKFIEQGKEKFPIIQIDGIVGLD